MNDRRMTKLNLTRAVAPALLAVALSLSSPACAGGVEDKLTRGLASVAFGISDLPGMIVKETRARGAIGFPLGLAEGLGMVVIREMVGVYEVLTAPFPIPAGYRPILSPDYPWGYRTSPERFPEFPWDTAADE